MAEGSYEHTISGWGLTQGSSDLDDAEDFDFSKEENSERFGPPISSEEIDKAILLRIPEKTRRRTEWVDSVFHAWCGALGVVEKITELGTDKLSDLLPRFVMEARRHDKTPLRAGFSGRYNNHSGKVTYATETLMSSSLCGRLDIAVVPSEFTKDQVLIKTCWCPTFCTLHLLREYHLNARVLRSVP